MGKLQPDYITWILSLNATGVEQEIYKLKQSSLSLREDNKLLLLSMKELTQAGKFESAEYNALNAKMKQNNALLTENASKIKHCESQISNTNKTYSQLKKQARDLQKTLENTSKALHPEEYARLEKELLSTRSAMSQLKGKTDETKSSFFSMSKMKASITGFFVGIGLGLQNAVYNFANTTKSFISDSISIASAGDGIRHAFKKIDEPGLLDNLRKNTKNAVSDVNLMKAAVKADFYKIPLTNLGNLFAFATQRAQATGRSVDDMVEIIVNGIGKKSPKVMSQLGLSVTQIKEETKQTGDFMSAVSNIIDKELAKSTDDYTAAATKAAQRTAELENKMLYLGQALRPIKSEYTKLKQSVKVFFADSAIWIVDHKESLFKLAKVIGIVYVITKTMTIAQAIYNTTLAVGKSITLAYAEVTALSTANSIRGAAATKLLNVQITAHSFLARTAAAATYLFAAAKAVLTGNLGKAKIAMQAFNNVVEINPYIIAITLFVAMAAAVYQLTKKVETYIGAQKELNEVENETRTKLSEQRQEIDLLIDVIHDETKSQAERYNAIKKLQSIVPGYNAEISKTGKITHENTKAIKDYLVQLEKQIRLEAIKGKLKDLYIQQIEAEDNIEKAKKTYSESKNTSNPYAAQALGKVSLLNSEDEFLSSSKKQLNAVNAKIEALKKRASANFTIDYVETAKEITDIVEKKKAEIKDVESMVARTEAEQVAKNKKLAVLKKELKDLEHEGVATSTGNKDIDAKAKEQLNAALKAKEIAYQQGLNTLKEYRQKESLSEEETNSISLQEESEFLSKKLAIQLGFISKMKDKKNAKELLSQAEQTRQSLLDMNDKYDQQEVTRANKCKNEDLETLDSNYKAQKSVLEINLAEQKITQAQYDMLTLSLEESTSAKRVEILKHHQNNVAQIEFKTGVAKVEAVKKAGEEVLNAELENAKDRANQTKALGTLLSDFKKEFNLTNLPDETDLQLKYLESQYQAKLELAKKSNQDITELDEAYATAKLNITREAEDKVNGVREKYGLVGFHERYLMQKRALDKERDQGLINAKDYAKAEKLIKINCWKEAFDYYSGLFGGAISALQEAEISRMEAKYDAEISAAQGNADEVTRLENEKAQKKLDIEKEYADAQFAVKASTIVANTAVAIMTGFAQLGPIGGAIAAAFLATTGIAQLSIANAERDKIKNTTLNASPSTSPTSTRGEQMPLPGYSEGGYTGDGGRLEVAGAVHRGEYVVPMPEMRNARVINAVKTIESIRRQRTGMNPLPGYSEGGYVSSGSASSTGADSAGLIAATQQLVDAAKELKKPQRNYVLLTDINAASDLQNKSEQPFTKGDKK